MQGNIKRTHFYHRFKERTGEDFTVFDKREIFKLIENKKFKKLKFSGCDRTYRFIGYFKNIKIIVVIDKQTADLVTCYLPHSKSEEEIVKDT